MVGVTTTMTELSITPVSAENVRNARAIQRSDVAVGVELSLFKALAPQCLHNVSYGAQSGEAVLTSLALQSADLCESECCVQRSLGCGSLPQADGFAQMIEA